jgi:hypothetical protein
MATTKIRSSSILDGQVDNADLSATVAVTGGQIADDAVTLAKMAGLVRGKIIVGDASGDPSALTVGAVNQVLKSDGTDVSWGTDVGGKIGQVLQGTKTDTFTSASASFVDITSLTVTITPSATSSKILVISNVIGVGTFAAAHVGVRILRDTTAIAIGDTAGSRTSESAGIYIADSGGAFGSMVNTWLDSPSTTSATVYKVQGWCNSTNTFYINRSQTDTDTAGYGRTVSTITVMEVLA